MKKTLTIVATTLVVLIAVGALIALSGAYNVAADAPHMSLLSSILETAREHSIATRADSIQVPGLDDAAMVRRGAGNYDAMCAACHRAPGVPDTELSVGLYPAPPDLVEHAHADPAEAFWIIKHGIQATGMPAWGKRMEDKYIWDLVAFLRKLPSLSVEQYKAEVAASGGHSHEGGESAGHSHADDEDHEESPGGHSHEAEEVNAGASHEDSDATSSTHTHADGTKHTHHAPAGGPVDAVKALHEAMSAGDAKQVQELLDQKVLIMEGGNVERSRSEYAGHHLPADLKFMQALTYKLERQTGDTLGDLAWVASEARLTGARDGKPIDMVSTETLVLKKATAGWKVVHIHWSSRAAKKQ